MELTSHARKRLQQRGMKPSDVDLIARYGSAVPGGYFLRRKDVQHASADMKRAMAHLERLSGHAVIMTGDKVLTAYVPGKSKQRWFLSHLEK